MGMPTTTRPPAGRRPPRGVRPAAAPGPPGHGRLELRLARRGGRTIVAKCAVRAPLGTVAASHPDGSGAAEVQVTHPAGGVLGGDRLEVAVAVGPSAEATLTTQGATRAYRGAPARQDVVLRVGPAALLEHLPHHVIPFAGSALAVRTRVRVAADARLFLWEGVAAGRVARGERFAFERLSSRLRIEREATALVADGLELRGGGEAFAGRSYLGAAYVAAPRDLRALADELHAELAALPGVLGSASAPTPGLCAVRVLADSAPALYAALGAARTAARAALGLGPPAREVG
jgi:urease accessory protein